MVPPTLGVGSGPAWNVELVEGVGEGLGRGGSVVFVLRQARQDELLELGRDGLAACLTDGGRSGLHVLHADLEDAVSVEDGPAGEQVIAHGAE